MSGEVSEWLRTVAWSVHRLVRDAAVMDRFRAMVLRWYLDVRLRDSERAVWERLCEEHFDAMLATSGLCDRSVGPPQPAWVWWQAVRAIHECADERWVRQVYVQGWAPPEIAGDGPQKHWPLPLSKRLLLLNEKYTLLAAIHDHCCEGVEQIKPWSDSLHGVKSWAENLEGMEYVRLYHHDVPAMLEVEQRLPVEAFLKDVAEDLRLTAATNSDDGLGKVAAETPIPPDVETAVQRAVQSSKTTAGGDPVEPVIDNEEKSILVALRDKHPMLVTNYDLEAATNITRKTVGLRIKGLISQGLVMRPQGKRGVAVTRAGCELADRISPKSAP